MFSVILALFIVILCVIYLWRPKGKENKDNDTPLTTIPGLKKGSKMVDNKDNAAQLNFLIDLHKRYGPIVSFWEDDTMAISVNTPELLKETRNSSTMPPSFFESFREITGPGNFMFQPVEEILNRRKIYDQFFMMKACKTHFDILKEGAEEYIEKWKNNTEKDHIPLADSMNTAAIKAVLRVTFGETFKNEEKVNTFKQDLQLVTKSLGVYFEPDSPEHAARQTAVKNIEEIVKQALADRRKELENGSETNIFIDVLLDDHIPEDQRSGDSFGFFLGSGTLNFFLILVMYNIMAKPEMQDKLFDELKTVLGDGSITLENYPKLMYLRRIIEETLRYHLLFHTGRVAEKDMIVGGHFIPKGTNIYQPIGVCHHDPAHWQKPKEFDPEHFSSENIKNRHPYAFKPFGFAGRRICPGMSFAYTMLIIFTAVWVQKYQFALLPGQKAVFAKTPIKRLENELTITIVPRN